MESGAQPGGDMRRHRGNTRARLIRAGRQIFFEQDYVGISIDRIAREAGFTRAAFYLHFAGKDDLVAAIMLEESHRSDAMFRWFERDPPTPRSIESFIRAFLDAARASRATRLFHLAALQSAAARDAFLENRRRLMTVLGDGFPAFRPPADDSGEEVARLAAATMALVALEQQSLREHDAASPMIADCMVGLLRDQWQQLHICYPAPVQGG